MCEITIIYAILNVPVFNKEIKRLLLIKGVNKKTLA